MLSVLIEMRDDDAAGLATTLACLVPGAIDGLVREVVILDAGIGPQAREVAEHAGCTVRPSQELGDVVTGARGEWLLLLEAGAELLPGWIEIVARHVGAISVDDRGMRFRASGRRWLSVLFVPSRSRRLLRGVLARRAVIGRSFRIGMHLRDLAAVVPTRPLDALILPPGRQ